MDLFSDVKKFYKKYFDIIEGKDYPRFDMYGERFFISLKNCFVYDLEHISTKKIRIKFEFMGSKCKSSGDAHFNMKAKFAGSIICNDVTSQTQKKVRDPQKEHKLFDIKKRFWSKKKSIKIQNDEIGNVVIVCKKLYAESLDCYFMAGGEWVKE